MWHVFCNVLISSTLRWHSTVSPMSTPKTSSLVRAHCLVEWQQYSASGPLAQGDAVSMSPALLIMDCIDLSLHWREEKVQSPNQNIGPWCPWHRQPGLHVVLPLAFQKPAEEGEGLSAPLSMLSHGIVSRAVWRITRLSASSCKVLDQTSWLHESRMVLKCPFWFWQLCVGLCAHWRVCISTPVHVWGDPHKDLSQNLWPGFSWSVQPKSGY